LDPFVSVITLSIVHRIHESKILKALIFQELFKNRIICIQEVM